MGSEIIIRFGQTLPHYLSLTDPISNHPFQCQSDEWAFNKLPADVKAQLTEYATWIYSDEGRAYTKRMAGLKHFL